MGHIRILIVLVISAAAWITVDARAEDQPNIIFIMADDLGWQDVGYMGAKFFETPHIDALAAEGISFSAAYSGGPNCAPTRACLMTGTYTPRHHIYTPGGKAKGNAEYMRLLVPVKNRRDKNLEAKADAQFAITNSLDPSFVCIPEILRDAGYQTARLGKWHLGDDTQGFHLSSANGKGGPNGSFYGNVDVAQQLTDRALQFMEDNRDGPFFLYVAHWDVHVPHRAKKAVVAKYADKLEKLSKRERLNFNPVYAAMIEAVDQSVGRIADKVDELGIGEQTLIVFTSDNGGLPGVSQLDPLRGSKGSLFEAGVRVAACMRWPGTIESGAQCATPITSVDYLPTFARLAGGDLPETQPVDGTDITPLLRGDPIEERSIFWHYPLYLQGKGLTIQIPASERPNIDDQRNRTGNARRKAGGNRNQAAGDRYSWRGFPSTSMRRGDWKLIEFHEDQSIGLFHLAEDPGETRNLASEMPDRVAELKAELDRWQDLTDAPIPSLPNPECVLAPISTPIASLPE